jgi:tripartite-type tricarboxylate transporter receptor subunit TctC
MLLPCVEIATAMLVALLLATAVHGQEYPQRPIRLVTSEPGGSTDFVARIVAQGITTPMGQPVIVDNRGGGGSISGEIVTHAAPDGYTVLVTGSSFWGAPLFRKTTYDPVRGFTPISFLVNSPNVLVVYPGLPVKTVKDLIDLAKSRPGQLNYGSSSVGSSVHLAGELFKAMAGVDIVHVPYKGSGPSFIGLISGQVQMMWGTAPSSAAHIKSGKLRALAISTARQSAVYPELPTVAATVPGYESGGATAMFAPPKTPAAIVGRIHREIVQMFNQPGMKEKFLGLGSEVVASSPEQLGASVKADMARLGKVIKDAGLNVD